MQNDDIEVLRLENESLRRQLAAFDTLTKVEADSLSQRESQIFLAIGSGQTTQEIAAAMHLSTSTIDTYRERIKTKLHLASGRQLIRAAVLYLIRRGSRSATAANNSPEVNPVFNGQMCEIIGKTLRN